MKAAPRHPRPRHRLRRRGVRLPAPPPAQPQAVRARLVGRATAARRFDAQTEEGRALFLAASQPHRGGGACADEPRGEPLVELRARASPSSPTRSPPGATSPSSSARSGAASGSRVDESRVERPQRGAERGAGVRVVPGDTTYFAHVDGLAEADLRARRRPPPRRRSAASGASRRRSRPRAAPWSSRTCEVDPAEVPAERKADLLRACDERARGGGRRDRPGPWRATRRTAGGSPSPTPTAPSRPTTAPACGFGAQVVARRGDRVETGFETLGGHRGFELVDGGAAEEIADQAAAMALTLLDAEPAPAGAMPVVVGGGFGGVLFHEMTGHGLEADHIAEGRLRLHRQARRADRRRPPHRLRRRHPAGRVGNRRDRRRGNALPAHARSSRTASSTSFLYDLAAARKQGVESTGNGRRESFRHLPIPRMTNTFIAPGRGDPRGADRLESTAASTPRASPAARSTRPRATSSSASSEGYLIEGGKVGKPCRGATLIGNCLDALRRIDAVADDFDMKTGFCGKGGPARAGRHRPGPRARRPDDGRRHGGLENRPLERLTQ